jgi:hypothetical protein
VAFSPDDHADVHTQYGKQTQHQQSGYFDYRRFPVEDIPHRHDDANDGSDRVAGEDDFPIGIGFTQPKFLSKSGVCTRWDRIPSETSRLDAAVPMKRQARGLGKRHCRLTEEASCAACLE